MRATLRALVLSAAAAAIAPIAAPSVAEACGGCFAPPTAVQTVTYHRMALSASNTRTILWDQFGYAGNPEEFSWILPIQGGPDVRVELADVRFLAVLDQTSAPSVQPPNQPWRSCPVCYTPPSDVVYDCNDYSAGPPYASADAASAADAFAPSDGGGVIVHREETVGPYAVVVIGGTDPMALRTWLTDNGYAVPAALEPVIDHYVSLHMDFVALRLRDGAGLGQMQPVRVSAPGYQPLLPLRMVAAGVADSVELVLFTLASTRLEAMNFTNTEIDNQHGITWDFATDTTPITAFRRAERELSVAANGRAWLTEMATTQSRYFYDNLAQQAQRQWISETDGGTVFDDMNLALDGLGDGAVLTRLHANLSVDALDSDLLLQASTQPDHANYYFAGTTLHTPTPAACEPLHCANDLIIGGEGEIHDPWGTTLAPETVLPERYTRDSLPTYTPRFEGWNPRYTDGRAYTPPPPRHVRGCPGPDGGVRTGVAAGGGCAVAGTPSSDASTGTGRALLLAAAAVGGLVVARRRIRRRTDES